MSEDEKFAGMSWDALTREERLWLVAQAKEGRYFVVRASAQSDYHDTHRCDRCGHEWEDDGGYYHGCPRCAVELRRTETDALARMSWDAMTPGEQRSAQQEVT